MSKKALIFGLSLALLASTVVGALPVAQAHGTTSHDHDSDDSRADIISWGTLTCSPSVQSATSGQLVSFTAAVNGGNQSPTLTWSAVGGNPSTGTGSSFSTRFYVSGINQTNQVTVTDGHSTCMVLVNITGTYPTPTWYPHPTWTPYPTPYQYLQCSPNYSTVNSGDVVSLSAWGGNGSYTWYAQDGTPVTGSGSTFSTRFYNNGYNWNNGYNGYNYNSNISKTVTVTSNGQTATCTVSVLGNNYYTPTPTPGYNYVSMDHSVTNVTTGQSVSSPSGVSASNGDRIRFTATVNTNGSMYVSNLRVQDVLPAYVGYIPGTTKVNGVAYPDGITGGGITLNTVYTQYQYNQYPYNYYNNQTYTVTFDAQVLYNPYSTQSLDNYVYLTGSNVSTITKSTRVYVNGHGYGYPTPTPTPCYYYNCGGTYGNGLLTLTVSGRNVTKGQISEYSTVGVRANDTVDIILHVRAATSQYLNNVMVTDYLPAGLSYVYGSTTVNGTLVADGITSSGVNIGSLANGQEAVVKFSARVDSATIPTWGSVSVINSAQVRADNTGTISGSMQINLGDSSVLTGIGNVKTGPADDLMIAFAFAALATGLYAAYAQSELFGRRASASEIARIAGRNLNFSR